MKLDTIRPVRWQSRALYDALFVGEHFIRRSETVRRLKANARARIAAELRARGPGRVIPVDRIRDLSPERFRRDYLHRGVPVIMEGAARDWKCTREWSFASWKARFGHETIQIADRPGLTDEDYVDERELTSDMNFGDFLDQALAGGKKYIRFSPLFEKFPALADDVNWAWLRSMPDRSFGLNPQLFVGGPGSATPIHNAMTVFLFVNVVGIKRWTFVPNRYVAMLDPPADARGYNHSDAVVEAPDVERFPGLECVDRMETVMQPGDVLFNPSWNWHSVKNDTETIGIRFGMIRPTTMISESPALAFIRVFGGRHWGVPLSTTFGSARDAALAIVAQLRAKRG